jgi:arylsulfatase A-like enzyme
MRLLILLAAVAAAFGAQAERPANVLLLFADDQRHDTIRALGNPHIETPHLDALVARGTAFTGAYIMGGRNAAVCMPSRAMLMTGRPLYAFDDSAREIPTAFETMPARFSAAGYQTFFTGKWHQEPAALNRVFADGGAIFLGGMKDHFAIPLLDYAALGGNASDQTQVNTEVHSSTLFADAAIGFLKRRDREKPFFLMVSFTAPHDPRTAPQEFHERYNPATLPLPASFAPEHPFDNGELRIRDELLAAFPRDPNEIRRHLADYYAMITHMDAEIGRVLEALRAAGAFENTLIVFAADNGLAVGSHGLLGKQSVYEHSVRVPLIFAGPGVPENARRGGLVYLNDLFPTLMECFGLPAPSDTFARSFAPLLRGETDEHREAVTLAYKNVQRGLRMGPWKLIRYAAGPQHMQLFHLEDDPHELRNLAAEPEHAARVQAMTERLVAELRAQGDPLARGGDAEIFR